MVDSQCGGCGCSMGGRKTRKMRKGGQPETIRQMITRVAAEKETKKVSDAKEQAGKPTIADLSARIKARQDALKHKKVGGTVVGDALLAGTVLGLYSYFTKKRGGQRMPKRKTKKALV